MASGEGEGGAKAKDAPVALDAIEVSEARRRRLGEAGEHGVPELVAIRRKGALSVANCPGLGTETMSDLDTFPLDGLALDIEAVAGLELWWTASRPEIVPRRWWNSRVLEPG